MKICVAQIESLFDNVQANVEKHYLFVQKAVERGADIIVFPELSITGYYEESAKGFIESFDISQFDLFQELADKHYICIGIGMPKKADDGINIGMLIFKPTEKSRFYTKQILDPDELPYFVPGKKTALLHFKKQKIAFGICYETLQREHLEQAHLSKADFYIASSAKSQNGIERATTHLSKMASEFNTPVAMSNCVGSYGEFLSAGQSAVWNSDGKLLHQLDSVSQGILIFDTTLDSTEFSNLT